MSMNIKVRTVKNGVFQLYLLRCYIAQTITHPSRVIELLPVEFSNTIILNFITPFQNHRTPHVLQELPQGSTNIPFCVTDATPRVLQNDFIVTLLLLIPKY